MGNGDPSVLSVRFTGPSVQKGRISLRHLAAFAKGLQRGVERTAYLLESQGNRRKYGPTAKKIQEAAALDLVGLQPGSVVLALDRHADQMQLGGMDLGEAALKRFFEALDEVRSGQPSSPGTFDKKILQCWTELGTVLRSGVTAIEFRLSMKGEIRAFYLDRDLARRVAERIECPVGSSTVVEGQLVMGDFKEGASRCRIHPPTGRPVVCEFDEALADTVYSLLRGYVRAWGNGEIDPTTGFLTKLHLRAIEPVCEGVSPASVQSVGWNDFWEEKSLDKAAAEQGISPLESFDAVFGRGRDLWKSDAELEAFVKQIYERRAQDAMSNAAKGTDDGRNPDT